MHTVIFVLFQPGTKGASSFAGGWAPTEGQSVIMHTHATKSCDARVPSLLIVVAVGLIVLYREVQAPGPQKLAQVV